MEVQHPDIEAPFLEARDAAARERLALNRGCLRILLGAVLTLGGGLALEHCQPESIATAEVFNQTNLPLSHK